MIAPYWGDVDTRGTGTVTVRRDVLNELIVTWDKVGYFSQHTDKLASFQLVLRGSDYSVPSGEGNVGFFYKNVEWETGDASGGRGGFGGTEAAVGLSDGLPTVNPFEYSLEGSQEPGISQHVSNSYFWLNVPTVGDGYENGSGGSNGGSCSGSSGGGGCTHENGSGSTNGGSCSGSSGGGGCTSSYGANSVRYRELSSYTNEFNEPQSQSFFDSNNTNWTEDQELSYFDINDILSEEEIWNYYINDPEWNNFINDTNWWSELESESPVSVPESTSALGLLILSAWGIVKALKIRFEK